jgi:hypothetical protein
LLFSVFIHRQIARRYPSLSSMLIANKTKWLRIRGRTGGTATMDSGEATALRNEIDRLRLLAKGFNDRGVLTAIEALVHELETRARVFDNGSAAG